MDVQDFVSRLEAAERTFAEGVGRLAPVDLRQHVTGALQHLEAARIAGGEDAGRARAASWKRAKVLHGLGYPVDFGWLHAPLARAA